MSIIIIYIYFLLSMLKIDYRSSTSNKILHIDPPVSYEPDFDVTDDIKFIDSLIQTMPADDSR